MTSKLTEEEEAFVQQARKLAEQRAKQSSPTPIANPEKFSAPIGMTDSGDLFGDAAGLRDFDPYTPTTTDVRAIWETLRTKVASGRATQIAIVSPAELDTDGIRRLLVEQPIPGLSRLAVVRDERVVFAWP